MYSNNKQIRDVAAVAAQIMSGQQPVAEELKGGQKKIDKNHNNKIDGQDFAILRGEKKANEEVGMNEEDAYSKDRYAVKNGKATKDNPTHMGSPNYKDQPHHVWADSAEHAVRKHAAKTAAPVKEDVQQLDEIGDTPAGQKRLLATGRRSFLHAGTKKGGKANVSDLGQKTMDRVEKRLSDKSKNTRLFHTKIKNPQAHPSDRPGLVSRAVGAVKKALTREEIERLDELDAAAIAAYKASPASNKKSSVPHRAGPGPSKFKEKMAAVSRTAEKGHDYFGHDAKRQQSGYRGPGQSVLQTAADKVKNSAVGKAVSGGIKAVKKAFTREEVEAIFNDFTLEEIQTFMMSEEFANLHVESQEQIDSYLEDRLLDEGFPSVEDAKKRMAAGKTQHGSVTKTATGLVHKRDYKDDNDEDDAPKKKSGYGARQNYKRSTRVNESLSFTEMLELYNEHGLKVLAPIETEEMDIDGTTIQVIDGDKVNGFVETMIEEPTNDQWTKELKDQEESSAGKKKQPKVAAGKTMGVKTMPEEVELDERSLTPDEKSEMEKNVKGMKKKLSGFKQRYGERAKEVMYATATKMAKKD